MKKYNNLFKPLTVRSMTMKNRIAKNRGIRCTINPDVIYEDSYKNKKVKKEINVVVIGGGTAGLEAACTAAEVGCTTFLLEEKPYLGGLAREIAKLPEKDRINDFPDYCNTLVKIKATVVGIIFFEDNKIEKLKAYYKGYVDYKSKKRGRSYE